MYANSCLCVDRHAAKRGGESEVPGTCLLALKKRLGGALIRKNIKSSHPGGLDGCGYCEAGVQNPRLPKSRNRV